MTHFGVVLPCGAGKSAHSYLLLILLCRCIDSSDPDSAASRDCVCLCVCVLAHGQAGPGAPEPADESGPGRPPRDPCHEADVAADGSLVLVCGTGLPHSRLLTAGVHAYGGTQVSAGFIIWPSTDEHAN